MHSFLSILRRNHCEQYEIGLDIVDPTDLNNLKKAVKKNTKVDSTFCGFKKKPMLKSPLNNFRWYSLKRPPIR